ncbi:hypothetical protein ANRL3_02307 [Anaerolineae bacterium]|nr:hypothetical protein ANRL3_02307 [Anaerolineae bacterium]
MLCTVHTKAFFKEPSSLGANRLCLKGGMSEGFAEAVKDGDVQDIGEGDLDVLRRF